MKLSQSVLYSIILSLLLTAGIAVMSGVTILGIVLLLPIGFLISSQRKKPAPKQSGHYRSADPVEPN